MTALDGLTNVYASTQRLRTSPYWLVSLHTRIESLTQWGSMSTVLQAHCVVDDWGNLVAVEQWA